MSAIQKTDKLLTLKTDSKQIDISIFNMESTYSKGTTMTKKHLGNLGQKGWNMANLIVTGFISFRANNPHNLVQGGQNNGK